MLTAVHDIKHDRTAAGQAVCLQTDLKLLTVSQAVP